MKINKELDFLTDSIFSFYDFFKKKFDNKFEKVGAVEVKCLKTGRGEVVIYEL